MQPSYNLDKIRFSTDSATWGKAVNLYCDGKVKNFESDLHGFTGKVLGTNLYNVSISAKKFDRGYCDCYMGQNDYLCKHIVALAICAVKNGKPLDEKEKNQKNELTFSGKTEELTKTEFEELKKEVSHAARYIKSYNGPSSTWFAYQDSLTEGCNRLRSVFSELPANPQLTKFILEILLKLDDKLSCGGVDDSDGTVGGFIDETIELLKEFVRVNPDCKKEFKILEERSTCFDWEKPLLEIV